MRYSRTQTEKSKGLSITLIFPIPTRADIQDLFRYGICVMNMKPRLSKRLRVLLENLKIKATLAVQSLVQQEMPQRIISLTI